MVKTSNFRVGQRVRVKLPDDIASTLDTNGTLGNLPFMPEMAALCGREFTIQASSHKTCDTVTKTGNRYVDDTVHLAGASCTGEGHGGCDAQCLLYWKSAWLEPALETSSPSSSNTSTQELERMLNRVSQQADTPDAIRYFCQATELPNFSRLAHWWDPRQYWLDLRTGNINFSRAAANTLTRILEWLMGHGFAYRIWKVIYDRATGSLGVPINRTEIGTIPKGLKTPVDPLDLRIGERVRIRPYEEILGTLDVNNKNRGMRFDPEMAPFCGGTYTVRGLVRNILDEQSGHMIEMKTPAVILDGAICESRFSSKRLFCPRALPSFWRESWLKRVEPDVIKIIDEPQATTGE